MQKRIEQQLISQFATNELAQWSINMITPNRNKTDVRLADISVNYQNALNDAHVASCVQTRKSSILAYEWEVQAEDENAKTICEQILNDIEINRFIEQSINTVLYGYDVFEISYWYKTINGTEYLLPESVQEKPQNWFVFDNKGICKFINSKNPNGIMLPARKFLILQNDATYDNPYGQAVLGKCLWNVMFKKIGINLWMKYIEKFGIGKFVGTTASKQDADIDNMLEQLDSLIQDASAVIGSDDKIEVLNGADDSNNDIYTNLINYCNSEISKAILSETLTTEMTGTGSYAASKVHQNVLNYINESDKSLIEKAINRLFKYTFEINGIAGEIPTFLMYQKQDVDADLANVTHTLLADGTIKFTKEYYINRFGFDESEFEIAEAQTQQNAFAENESTDNLPNPAGEKGQDLTDKSADNSIIATEKYSDELVKKILAKLENCTNYDEALETVFKDMPELKYEEAEELIARSLYFSSLSGIIETAEKTK